MTQTTTTTEQIKVKGPHLVARVKQLIREGNVRRIIIRDSDGKSVMEVPVTFGVLGVLAAPTLTAVGAIAAFAADYSIEVERTSHESTAFAGADPGLPRHTEAATASAEDAKGESDGES